MKKIMLLAFILCGSAGLSAQVTVQVLEPVELMAILSRTAGFREYSMDTGGQYTRDTEAWFGAYRELPSVTYYQALRSKFGISYDAVMSLAVNLSADGKDVSWLDADMSALGDRWSKVDKDTLLMRLNQFYHATRFHDFFTAHRAFYDQVVAAYTASVMKFFHQDWYAKFYGTAPDEDFGVIVGCTNGHGNYGVNRTQRGRKKEVFAIVGYEPDQATGQPFGNGMAYASTLIHEFNHSFVNPLLQESANWEQLKPAADYLYRCSALAMQRQAYGNVQTLVNESVVRAAVICYMADNGFSRKEIQDELYEQIARDFKWMPELVSALHQYARHRSRYPTLADYYPEIAKVLAKYAARERKRIEAGMR